MAKNYRELIVWQKSMDLTVEVYSLTRELPDSEKFGLKSQMQRAASSIPSNIAEGHARQGTGHYIQHLGYAQGSLAELETQLILTTKLGMLSRERVVSAWTQADEIGRMLRAIVERLSAPPSNP